MTRSTAWSGVFIALSGLLISSATAETVTDYDVIYTPAMSAPKASQATLTEIVDTGERQVAVGDFGVVVFRDGDNGGWQQAQVDTSVMLTSVSFANANLGWAVGHHGVIMHSTDGGQTWQRQLDGFDFIKLQQEHYSALASTLETQLDEVADTADGDIVADLEFALDEALFRAETAELASEEGPTKPFLDVLALSPETILVAGAYGTLLRSTDGGESWNILDDRVNNPDGLHFNALTQAGDTLYLTGEGGQIFHSRDQGDSWAMLDSPYYGSFFNVHVDREGLLWVVGLRGNIFVSDDQGQSFSPLNLADVVNVNQVIDAPNGGVYLVGNAGVIARVQATGEIQQTRHDSGAVLTDLTVNKDGSLTLVGQRGVLQLDAFTQSESN